MRFVMLVIPKGYESAAPNQVPSTEGVARMAEFNRSLQQAGVLLALDGLFPPSAGVRVTHTDGKATVMDGPFADAKEVIGGYWIIQVRSREEAIEWAKRAPMTNNEIIEVRQIFEMSDFPEEAREVGFRKDHKGNQYQ
ncbi:MAG TPA: YciI family protein [Acidobacteriaceae bacterium]|nr:YciI family protein [Acidobacteriaceae bacterium]